MRAPNGKIAKRIKINPANWSGGEMDIFMTPFEATDVEKEEYVAYMNVYDYWIRVERKKFDLHDNDGPPLVWNDFKCYMEGNEYASVSACDSPANGVYAFQTELGEAGIIRDDPDVIVAIAQVFCNII